MPRFGRPPRVRTFSGLAVSIFLLVPSTASGHCDSYSGPVIGAAKQALEKRDVTPVLKWVEEGDEDRIREAFRSTLAVRAKGPEAQELADKYFFETLVRIHRAGEGAPYTGLKNEPPEPIIYLSDKALTVGSADALMNELAAAVKKGVGERFAKAHKAAKSADKSVEAGREYVEAYVDFVHYTEALHRAVVSGDRHHEGGMAGAKADHDH